MYGSPSVSSSLDILADGGVRLLRDGVRDELEGLRLVARVEGECPAEEEVRPHEGRRPRRGAASPTEGERERTKNNERSGKYELRDNHNFKMNLDSPR